MLELTLMAGALALHVAPGGSDELPGTADQPLASLAAALERTAGRGEARITLHRGIYPVVNGLVLDRRHSGLTLAAAPGELVVISGFRYLPLAGWSGGRLKRVLDETAAKSLLVFDLKAAGLGTTGGPSRRGFGVNDERKPAPAQLYSMTERLTLARWPNADQPPARMARVIDAGPVRKWKGDPSEAAFWSRGGTFTLAADRLARWTKADEIWVDGVFSDHWCWSYNRLAAISPAAKTITLAQGESNGIRKADWLHDAFHFENLPEELDVPGEYWIDRLGGKVYLDPPEKFSGGRLSWARGPLLSGEQVSGVTLEGLVFEGGRSDGVVFKNSTGVTLRRCEVRFCTGDGVRLDGSRMKLAGSQIHHTGARGVVLTGGSTATLTASGNVIEDCRIHHPGEYDRAYSPAISLEGVGHVVRRCELSSTPHMAIQFSGNDHVITQNDLHHTCERFGDMSAIYTVTGGHPEWRGTRIERNYFHDMANDSLQTGSRGAVYLDNGSMGVRVAENVFNRVGRGPGDWAVMNHGGRDIVVEKNQFFDCPLPFQLVFYFNASGKDDLPVMQKQWDAVWKSREGAAAKKKYPELASFTEGDPVFPTSNIFSNNIIANPSAPLAKPEGFAVDAGPAEKLQTAGNKFAKPEEIPPVDPAAFGPAQSQQKTPSGTNPDGV